MMTSARNYRIDQVRNLIPRVSKFQLMDLFLNCQRGNLYDSCGRLHQGTITNIQLEDGSGSSFNVTMGGGQTFHLRTID